MSESKAEGHKTETDLTDPDTQAFINELTIAVKHKDIAAVKHKIIILPDANLLSPPSSHRQAMIRHRSLYRGFRHAIVYWTVSKHEDSNMWKILFVIFKELLESFPSTISRHIQTCNDQNESYIQLAFDKIPLLIKHNEIEKMMPFNNLLYGVLFNYSDWLSIDQHKEFVDDICLIIEKLAEVGWCRSVNLSKYEEWDKYVRENINNGYIWMIITPRDRVAPVFSRFSEALVKGKAKDEQYRKVISKEVEEYLLPPLVDIVGDYIGFFRHNIKMDEKPVPKVENTSQKKTSCVVL